MQTTDTTQRTMEEIAADPAMRFLAVTDFRGKTDYFAISAHKDRSADSRLMEFEGVAKGNAHHHRRITGAEWLAAQRKQDEALLKLERQEASNG